jgi:hypothetical protein
VVALIRRCGQAYNRDQDAGHRLPGRRVALVACGLALLPCAAWANSGIGFLLVSAPAIILALIPAIFIEAPVIARMLGLPFKDGLRLSTRANLISTFLGIAIGLGVDFALIFSSGGSGPTPNRAVLVFSLLPMFFITWWIERWVIARKMREIPKRRVTLATLAANAVSYSALVATVIATPLFDGYDHSQYREDVYFAMRRGGWMREQVTRYWMQNQRFPERVADVAPASPEEQPRYIRAITLGPGGRIEIELRFPREPKLDGKRLILEPVVTGGRIESWRCLAPDVPRAYVPHECREPGAQLAPQPNR